MGWVFSRACDSVVVASNDEVTSWHRLKSLARSIRGDGLRYASDISNQEWAEIAAAVERGRAALAAAGFGVDYFEARHADMLKPIAARNEGPVRLLAAARLGKTRLIDNVAV